MKSASLPSANAVSASVLAGPPSSSAKAAFSRSRAASIPARSGSMMVRLTATSEEIGRLASSSACSRATPSSSSGSQTWRTRPISRACSASNHSADISSHDAAWRPISSGSR